MEGLTVIKDVKKEVEFWLNALSNENVNEVNKELLNKCLNLELQNYICPITLTVVPLDDSPTWL